MAQALEKVPVETRWTIATRALTGAVTAASKVLRDALGQESFNEVWGQVWAEQGKASKQVADALGLVGDDAKSVAEILQSVATVAMGPECKFDTVEATAERAVTRITECPWWKRQQELEIAGDLCSVSDPAWCNGLARAINPKLTVTLIKALPLGDSCCEWVYELEK